eukprot:1159198-Pelagomonas_calceolata.AAC.7
MLAASVALFLHPAIHVHTHNTHSKNSSRLCVHLIPNYAGKGAKKGGGKGGGGGEKKDKKGGGLLLDSVFTMHTQSMDLKVDETQELTVFAFPTEVGVWVLASGRAWHNHTMQNRPPLIPL